MLCPFSVIAGSDFSVFLYFSYLVKLFGCAEARIGKSLTDKLFNVGLINFRTLTLLVGTVIPALLVCACKAFVNCYAESSEPVNYIRDSAFNLTLFVCILNSGIKNTTSRCGRYRVEKGGKKSTQVKISYRTRGNSRDPRAFL